MAFVKVVIEKGFAGVVAEEASSDQARAARDAIEVKWNQGRLWQQSELEELVTVGGPHGVNIQREGGARSVLAREHELERGVSHGTGGSCLHGTPGGASRSYRRAA